MKRAVFFPEFKLSFGVPRGLNVFVLLLLFAVFAGLAPTARAATFTVDSATDAVDAAPGDGVCATAGGVCTLRAAIQEANARAGDDIISVPAGTYTLTIAGTGENAAASGDLDITSNITVNGAGASDTIIQAGTLGVGGPPNGIDRVFHVTGAFTVNISGVTIRNGNANLTSDNGGGIFNNGGTLTITNSIISGNSADLYGGGIEDESGTLTITNSTISGNNVNAQGGGIFTHFGTLTITNSTFSGNNADDAGGGIFNFGGAAAITNSTFSGNSAPGGGGAILGFGNAGTLTITNSTFFNNSATNFGGGIRVAAGTATLHNTIVANSLSGGNCSGPTEWITNGGNNLDSGTSCGWGSASGSMSNTNPLLGPLQDNGGPTFTHALLSGGSPAFDAGDDSVLGLPLNLATDQRGAGFARKIGAHVDIGAFEFAGVGYTGTLITRYRLYSDGTKEHLYTTDTNEYSVLPVCCGWVAEGAIYQIFEGAGSLAGVDAVPYYRLYNPNSHQHHWTTDLNEYTVLGTLGWTTEGIVGYILPTAVTGTLPLYRLYLNAYGGLHLWTTDANERNVLTTTAGWVDEGVAGYVVPLP